MSLPINRTDVDLAADDLRRRTLSHMPVPLERMIYLGSTRDYNTGLYYHCLLYTSRRRVASAKTRGNLRCRDSH